MQAASISFWSKLPVSLRSILSGLLIALVAANVWPILLLSLGVPLAVLVEIVFLGLYLWWTSGGGPPRRTRDSRQNAFRCGPLSAERWLWGVIGAIFFAIAVHASIVLLFRCVEFPLAAFRRGYDLSFAPPFPLRVACRNRIGSISGRLRGNRFSWLYAATDRGTSWRSDCDFDISDFFYLGPPEQSLVVGRDGASRFRRWSVARAFGVVLTIADSVDPRAFGNGHRSLRLLVDRDCRRI